MAFFRERLRHQWYDEIHISPHMDDAVYSSGGRIAQLTRAGKRVLVVTLFGTGTQSREASAGKNRFANYEARWEEEQAAMERLGADYAWLNDPELLFRKTSLREVGRLLLPFLPLAAGELHAHLCAVVLELCEQRLAPGGTILFPFAVGFHPDHRIAFDVGRAVHALGRFDVEFYEDVSYSYQSSFMALRLTYLGIPTKTGVLRTSFELNEFVFRYVGALKWLAFPATFGYVLALFAARAVHGGEDRLPGEGLPRRVTRCIVDAIDDKVAAMRLYPTQTGHFFAMDDTLYDVLRRNGTFEEHSWIFPPAGSVAQSRFPASA